MKLVALTAALLVSSSALVAAQTMPSVSVTQVVNGNLLTIEQRQLVDNGRDALEFSLAWSVTNAGGRRYRVSFDRDDIRSSPRQLVPVIGQNEAEGSADANPTSSIIVSEDDLLAHIVANEETFGKEGTLNLQFLVFTVDEDPGEDSDVFRATWTFQYDFEAPDGPPLVLVTPGERSVKIQWTRPTADDLNFYQVQYCPGLEFDPTQDMNLGEIRADQIANNAVPGYRLLAFPCTDETGRVVRDNIAETEDQLTLSDGVEEGKWVAFTVLGEDEAPFRNLTTTATVYIVRTEPGVDFFERQRELGGGEDGGFCFVATAAHGSYAHPVVGALRTFRDEFLGRLPFGRALTRIYYDTSPPLAAALDRDPQLAEQARWVLLACVLTAGLALLMLGGVLGTWLMRGLGARRSIALFVVAGAALVTAKPARAQLRGETEGAIGWGVEFKAGPFLPDMGRTVADGGLQAWNEIYGPTDDEGETSPGVLFNIGGEIQFLRGDFGTISVGGTVGFTSFGGRVLTLDSNGFLQDGAEGSSTFNIIPMTLTLGYRFDLLMDRTPIPLAPYVRGGLAYHLWWNTRDDGSLSQIVDGTETRDGIGGRMGLVGTAGLALALNFIDRTSAAQFRATTGVRTSYLFFEGQLGWVDGFGDDSNFDFSDVTWFGGLMLEL